MNKKTENLEREPQVYKEREYQCLLDMVSQGAWRNNRAIASIVGVDENTLAKWKETEPIINARQKYINTKLLPDFIKKGDVKDRLKEAGFDLAPDKLDITSGGEALTPLLVKFIDKPEK